MSRRLLSYLVSASLVFRLALAVLVPPTLAVPASGQPAGQAAAAFETVICTEHGIQRVVIGAEGGGPDDAPKQASNLCPCCQAPHALDGVTAPVAVSSRIVFVVTAVAWSGFEAQANAAAPTRRAVARGPPTVV